MFSSPAPEADPRSFMRALAAWLGSGSPADQRESLLTFVASCLQFISVEQIGALRMQFIHAFGADSELVELIDGHVILRELTRAE